MQRALTAAFDTYQNKPGIQLSGSVFVDGPRLQVFGAGAAGIAFGDRRTCLPITLAMLENISLGEGYSVASKSP